MCWPEERGAENADCAEIPDEGGCGGLSHAVVGAAEVGAGGAVKDGVAVFSGAEAQKKEVDLILRRSRRRCQWCRGASELPYLPSGTAVIHTSSWYRFLARWMRADL